MTDKLIEQARAFIPDSQKQILGNYRVKMAAELMAAFHQQQIESVTLKPCGWTSS